MLLDNKQQQQQQQQQQQDEKNKNSNELVENTKQSSENVNNNNNNNKPSVTTTTIPAPATLLTPRLQFVFHQICRNLVYSAEVHSNKNNSFSSYGRSESQKQQQQGNNQQGNNQQEQILSSLATFTTRYHPMLVNAPHVALPVLTALASCIRAVKTSSPAQNHLQQQGGGTDNNISNNNKNNIKRKSMLLSSLVDPTRVQLEATRAANGLLGPLLRAVATERMPPSRAMSSAVCTLVSRLGVIGLWNEALTVLAKEIRGTHKIADARIWSAIAHVSHRPRPANWVTAITASRYAFASGGDVDDVMEAATASLKSLAWSDISYSQRSSLALQIFARARSFTRLVDKEENNNNNNNELKDDSSSSSSSNNNNGNDQASSGTTKRMLAAAVDALTMRQPRKNLQAASLLEHSMVGGKWSVATELFSNFVQTRAIDVTTATRWHRGASSLNSSFTNNHQHHKEADAVWRGRFAGRGRLGDEQRLASSLVRALSNEAATDLSVSGVARRSESLSTALMLCGGDQPALLRAAAESGSWVCALSTLVQLCNTRGTTATAAEKRRWVDDTALACLWAPNTAAYYALRRCFPNAHLPALDTQTGDEEKKSSYLSVDNDPECDSRLLFPSAYDENSAWIRAAAAATASSASSSSSSSSKSNSNSAVEAAKRVEQELTSILGPSSPSSLSVDSTRSSVSSSSSSSTSISSLTSCLRQVDEHLCIASRNQEKGTRSTLRFASPKMIGPYETQQIIDLTEKIWLVNQFAKQ